jgi:hypothetical protein
MLIFLIPLKSARVAVSWDRVSRLLSRTIASACRQTCGDFRVLVACHDIPAGDFSHPAVEFIPVEYPAPSPLDPTCMRVDKKRKLQIALHRALEYSPSHVMFLDSDDLVSRRLAEFVAAYPDEDGWYLQSGYFYCERQPYLHLERRRFDQWSGSSHIVRPERLGFLERMDERRFFYHTKLTRDLRKQGTPIRPLPFKGAVYVISHGDNLNDYERILWPKHPVPGALRRILWHRELTPDIREEFGLYALE